MKCVNESGLRIREVEGKFTFVIEDDGGKGASIKGCVLTMVG